ncbi:hypothetical protein FF86_103847 [Frankia sp. CpI1-P]|nr:hypothetical protein FF86_103847 [Frankia sp. CpI1-P]
MSLPVARARGMPQPWLPATREGGDVGLQHSGVRPRKPSLRRRVKCVVMMPGPEGPSRIVELVAVELSPAAGRPASPHRPSSVPRTIAAPSPQVTGTAAATTAGRRHRETGAAALFLPGRLWTEGALVWRVGDDECRGWGISPATPRAARSAAPALSTKPAIRSNPPTGSSASPNVRARWNITSESVEPFMSAKWRRCPRGVEATAALTASTDLEWSGSGYESSGSRGQAPGLAEESGDDVGLVLRYVRAGS